MQGPPGDSLSQIKEHVVDEKPKSSRKWLSQKLIFPRPDDQLTKSLCRSDLHSDAAYTR